MGTPVTVAIHGATGRMGARLISLTMADSDLRLLAAIDRTDHLGQGTDVGPLVGLGTTGVNLSDALTVPVDVVIDFSTPVASLVLAKSCRSLKAPLVVGTTGFDADQKAQLQEAASDIPLLISPNMSRAVNLLFRLVADAAKVLGSSADIEIVERHHHFKKDAPSGTAMRLAEVAAQAIGTKSFVHGREGLVGERPKGEIGLHALRTGDNPGEHTVVFGLMGECIELSHRALNRDGFALGALEAGKFLAAQPAGLYSMSDLLG